MKVGEIKEWLNNELDNPFAWQRILMRILPSFRNEGYFYHTIKDDDVLSDYLINEIDLTLRQLYKLRLPRVST